MDQLSETSRNKIKLMSSKEDYMDSNNIINSESEKTLTNIKLQDFIYDESNKNDLNSFFDIQDEVQDSYNNLMNKIDNDFMIKNDNYFYICKFCRISVGNDSII